MFIVIGISILFVFVLYLFVSSLRKGADTYVAITNPSFESDLSGWEYLYSPSTLSNKIAVSNDSCHTGKCVSMTPESGFEWQFIRQSVGPLLTGKEYTFEVWFKIAATSKARIAFVDKSWKDGAGNVINSGKGYWTAVNGTGDWTKATAKLQIPLVDDYGETVGDDNWYIYLSSDDQGTNNDVISYDDAFLRIIEQSNAISVLNPSFESDQQNWQYVYSPSTLSTAIGFETSGCRNGKCLRMSPAAGTSWQFVKQPIGRLEPGKEYVLDAWQKVATRSKMSIAFVNSSWKNSSGVVAGGGKGFWYEANGSGDWSKISHLIKIPLVDDYGETTTDDEWWVFLSTNIENGFYDPTYFDDISVSLETKYIKEYGCINSATSRCLDFGSQDETGGTFSLLNFSPVQSDNGITYRNLLPKQSATINLPAFNVDADGLPNDPLILEIKYKDIIDTTINDSSTQVPHRAIITSRIDYQSGDPLVINSTDKSNYPITYLGESGDSSWKLNQYPFQKSPLQLIRSINGTFSFTIKMPAMVASDDTLNLPIDYIAIHTVTKEEIDAFNLKQRESLGFYEATMSTNTVICSSCNSEITAYSKDIMEPIYKNSIPLEEEVNKPLISKTALGEIESFNLGLFSKNGMAGITVESSDLVGVQDTIVASNIEISRVGYAYSMLNTYGMSKSYAMMPDRLEKMSSFSIDPNKSQAVWVNVNVPKNLLGKKYDGKIYIKKNGTLLKELPLTLNVTPILLDSSFAKNIMYHEPYVETMNKDFANVFKVYRELGVDPFIYRNLGVYNNGGTVEFNTGIFEQALDKYVAEGVVNKQAEIETSSTWYSIFSVLYGSKPNSSMTDLYAKLDSQAFKNAFGQAIQKYQAIANARGLTFFYSVTDEPGGDPYLRIITDRLYPIIKANGGATAVTYSTDCEETISSGGFVTPAGNIPPLVVDYKIWHPGHQLTGYNSGNQNHAYYTTYLSNMRSPVYNRFLHGLFAYKTEAKVVSSYSMDDIINDPYNDFDQMPTYKSPFTYPDFLFAYPAWNGEFMPAMNGIGIREGIKDAKYIATLSMLISENSQTPAAIEAKAYLDGLKVKINPDLWNAYVTNTTSQGFYGKILKDLSINSSETDFAAFSTVRNKMIDYIEAIEFPENTQISIVMPEGTTTYPNRLVEIKATVDNATTFEWTVVSAPGTVTLPTLVNTSNISVGAVSVGRYVLRLTASNASGNSLSKDVTFNVNKLGDINGDESIDFIDFSSLLSNWGDTPVDIMADLYQEDNVTSVDFMDFSLLLSNWGK